MQKPYEKGQVQWQEDMEKVHVYMPKMHTRYHASLWEQTYQKSIDQLIFSKGVFSKPSGKCIVAPNLCFLS